MVGMGLKDIVPEDKKRVEEMNKVRIDPKEIDINDEEMLHWLGGFFDGEGSVSFMIPKDKTSRLGYRVNVQVRMSQHLKDEEDSILLSVAERLGVGKVYIEDSKARGEFVRFRCGSMEDSISFLRTIKPYTVMKNEEIKDAIEITDKIIKGMHLEESGIVEVVEDIEEFIRNHRTETQREKELKNNSEKLRRELLD